jgi:hypothetical protein
MMAALRPCGTQTCVLRTRCFRLIRPISKQDAEAVREVVARAERWNGTSRRVKTEQLQTGREDGDVLTKSSRARVSEGVMLSWLNGMGGVAHGGFPDYFVHGSTFNSRLLSRSRRPRAPFLDLTCTHDDALHALKP